MESGAPLVNMMPPEGHNAQPFQQKWGVNKGNFRPNNDIKIKDYNSEVMTVAYDDECALLAAGYGDGNINIYNAVTHRLITPIQRTLREDQVGFAMQCVRFRPSPLMQGGGARALQGQRRGTELLSVSSEGLIQHWSVSTGKCTHTITNEYDLNVCEFNRTGKLFFVGGSIQGDLDKSILCYDEAQRSVVCEMSRKSLKQMERGHSMRITNIKADPDNDNVLYTGGWDGLIKIYDIRQRGPAGTMDGVFLNGCDSMDVFEDQILTGAHTQDNQLSIHSISQRKKIIDIEWEENKYKQHDSGNLYGAKFSNDGDLIFCVSAGRNDVKVFDNSDQSRIKCVSEAGGLSSPVLTLAVGKSQPFVAYAQADGGLHTFQYSNASKLLRNFEKSMRGKFNMEVKNQEEEALEEAQEAMEAKEGNEQ